MALGGNQTAAPTLFTEVPADERGVRRGLLTRRVVPAVLVLVPLLALFGLIGQEASYSRATGARATPATVRGGLFFESRVTIRARTDEPQPQSESSRGDRLVLAYSTLLPADVWQVYFQFQVNPTNVGHRSYGIELDDDTTRVARIDRSVTVLP